MTERYVPMRRCAGCMKSQPKAGLLRVVSVEGTLRADEKNRLPGRGVYICRDPKCLQAAVRKNAFSRNFRRAIREDEYEPLRDALKRPAGTVEVV